jgi:hypothetical protein
VQKDGSWALPHGGEKAGAKLSSGLSGSGGGCGCYQLPGYCASEGAWLGSHRCAEEEALPTSRLGHHRGDRGACVYARGDSCVTERGIGERLGGEAPQRGSGPLRARLKEERVKP